MEERREEMQEMEEEEIADTEDSQVETQESQEGDSQETEERAGDHQGRKRNISMKSQMVSRICQRKRGKVRLKKEKHRRPRHSSGETSLLQPW